MASSNGEGSSLTDGASDAIRGALVTTRAVRARVSSSRGGDGAEGAFLASTSVLGVETSFTVTALSLRNSGRGIDFRSIVASGALASAL